MEQYHNMIPRKMLVEWHQDAVNDLEGLKINYIAKKTGYNYRTVERVLTLNGDSFDSNVIKAINELRDSIKSQVKALTL